MRWDGMRSRRIHELLQGHEMNDWPETDWLTDSDSQFFVPPPNSRTKQSGRPFQQFQFVNESPQSVVAIQFHFCSTDDHNKGCAPGNSQFNEASEWSQEPPERRSHFVESSSSSSARTKKFRISIKICHKMLLAIIMEYPLRMKLKLGNSKWLWLLQSCRVSQSINLVENELKQKLAAEIFRIY